MERRNFIKSAAILAGMSAVSGVSAANFSSSTKNVSSQSALKIRKSLGYGMIDEALSLEDKCRLVKDLGFDGIEFNSPLEFSVATLLKAKEKTGIELPSTVNKDHWSKPLSDPDNSVREAIIQSVTKSLEETQELGGDTVLVVPGVVNEKVPYEQAYNTALESIRKLIPVVERTGVRIGLENVWNNFILSPIEARRFVDEINHPLIGWYFDIGNILRYGWPEHWISTLNKRIVKLHLKEFSREKMNNKGLREGFNVELLMGDNNWPVVMKALRDIKYEGGWITAEVKGGDRNHLKKISEQMDQILAL
ncbi:MAG: sugar phosphate isomerase/epimerase family protein [Phocaeicola sp.]|uniref:sugar phosphate isomerase/epimerase family protein n=1 Tax=Phocaeicola TaxID=909656 RepID=UPI00234F29ED|nr:sugar phosphate isomerase/epimerase family protein [Phocaeicola oris]MCE2615919.1 sugar phosphate isomerase/epimerase [Phocaeicola oris]